MKLRNLTALLLAAAMLFALAACTSTGSTGNGGSSSGTQAPAFVLPKGAASGQELMNQVSSWINNGCQSEDIASVLDPRAMLAFFLVEDLYRDDPSVTFDDCLTKAELILAGEEALRAGDPELYALLEEEMELSDCREDLEEYLDDLRWDMRNGYLTSDDPEYAEASQLLTDWEQGLDFVIEHHPELVEQMRDRGVFLTVEAGLEWLAMRMDPANDREHLLPLAPLSCEYQPENVYVNQRGYCVIRLGSYPDGNNVWEVDMIYYVRNDTYYLAGFDMTVGAMGG